MNPTLSLVELRFLCRLTESALRQVRILENSYGWMAVIVHRVAPPEESIRAIFSPARQGWILCDGNQWSELLQIELLRHRAQADADLLQGRAGLSLDGSVLQANVLPAAEVYGALRLRILRLQQTLADLATHVAHEAGEAGPFPSLTPTPPSVPL